MKSTRRLVLLAAACVSLTAPLFAADAPDPAIQAKLAAKITEVQALAADPVIVNAVVAQNTHPSAAVTELTQEKWKALSVLDPAVRAFAKNEAGVFLKNHKPAWVSEAFLNDAHGLKVALLNKTTNWSQRQTHRPPVGQNLARSRRGGRIQRRAAGAGRRPRAP
jgi:hypothetical protein